MKGYTTIFDDTQIEYVEKRSRFIATLRHCEDEAEAMAFLQEMRTKYWDARHNCFAFLVENGKLCRFSDDGEPHGTAGKPMLDVVQGSGITNIAVVVTRYFGGILLGTGGLVRAYSKSVQDCIAAADVYTMIPSVVFDVTCDYTDHGRLVNLITSYEGNIDNTDFTDKVTMTFCLREEVVAEFSKKFTEIFSARLVLEENVKKLMPFKEK